MSPTPPPPSPPPRTINVLYSCAQCGLSNIPVPVPARTTESMLYWMELLTRALGADHYQRSPLCRTSSLSSVRIPVTGVSQLGGVCEN